MAIEKDSGAKTVNKTTTKKSPEVIAITACPTGIAHTYMAKEKITQMKKDKKNGSKNIN